jgi:hypothetical protein
MKELLKPSLSVEVNSMDEIAVNFLCEKYGTCGCRADWCSTHYTDEESDEDILF